MPLRASKSVSPIAGRRLCARWGHWRLCAGWRKRWLCAGWSRRWRGLIARCCGNRHLVALGVHALYVGDVVAVLQGVSGALVGAGPGRASQQQSTARADSGAAGRLASGGTDQRSGRGTDGRAGDGTRGTAVHRRLCGSLPPHRLPSIELTQRIVLAVIGKSIIPTYGK